MIRTYAAVTKAELKKLTSKVMSSMELNDLTTFTNKKNAKHWVKHNNMCVEMEKDLSDMFRITQPLTLAKIMLSVEEL